MQIISTDNRHITATDKKHIAALLQSGQTSAKINRAIWVVNEGDGHGEYKLTKIINDRGWGWIGDQIRQSQYTYNIKCKN